ncbi:MAG: amidohydrolase family protein [Adhaeribacter sp.]
MKSLKCAFILLLVLTCISRPALSQRIFDVHLHGSKDPALQMLALQKAGVYKAAISTSWDLQNSYKNISNTLLLYGLMFPCPNGKVPYSLQPCYSNGEDWPAIDLVEQQITEGKVDYFGEVLNQYYGISSSDSLLFPYYRLAQKHNLPVGIHTGGAGPDHGSPNFKMEMGNTLLMKPMLALFPKLKVWIMHSGDQYTKETISIMKENIQVYADISVISNPDIVPPEKFSAIMKAFMDAGLEDRLMFGTDNGDIAKVIRAVESLEFMSTKQKKKLYYQNAEQFFRRIKKD